MTDLVTMLRDVAKREAEEGEYDPSGHIDWMAADRIEQLEAALREARCPNKHCVDGAIAIQVQANNHDGWDYGLEQCEWCDQRETLLSGDGSKSNE